MDAVAYRAKVDSNLAQFIHQTLYQDDVTPAMEELFELSADNALNGYADETIDVLMQSCDDLIGYRDDLEAGVCKTKMLNIQERFPGMFTELNANEFTQQPSRVNLTITLEAIDGKLAAIITAAIAALALFIKKLVDWFKRTTSSQKDIAEDIIKKQTEINEVRDKHTGHRTIFQIRKELSPQGQQLLDDAIDDYRESYSRLIDNLININKLGVDRVFDWTNKNNKALLKAVGSFITVYEQLLKKPIISESPVGNKALSELQSTFGVNEIVLEVNKLVDPLDQLLNKMPIKFVNANKDEGTTVVVAHKLSDLIAELKRQSTEKLKISDADLVKYAERNIKLSSYEWLTGSDDWVLTEIERLDNRMSKLSKTRPAASNDGTIPSELSRQISIVKKSILATLQIIMQIQSAQTVCLKEIREHTQKTMMLSSVEFNQLNKEVSN